MGTTGMLWSIAILKAPSLKLSNSTSSAGTPPSGKMQMLMPWPSLFWARRYTPVLLLALSLSTMMQTLLKKNPNKGTFSNSFLPTKTKGFWPTRSINMISSILVWLATNI